ncbi:cysteine hydrolase [Acinetobacter qingfengensis]|uniref:Isochorismatase n=1 Tax=Acinetobacter qingfengensis TaxID=1262585 RepID=A0A1E7R931_9GAMM|nr:cysteine hydrolase family protein [Acinetobacter qingfengensis]KAA8735570.1 cysteine hydrolase [Acinetobacter qingfengensis]OEY95782.1 isochorismatase [Acinetobacter qingfengensis]
MKQALLIIDVQNDYFQGEKMPLFQPEQALKNIHLLEHFFHSQKLPVIYIQHFNSENSKFFYENTIGAELHTELALAADAIIVSKRYPNSFYQTTLQQTLQHLAIEQLVITGMMTHMCIDSTTRHAAELGFQPILIHDATATKDLNDLGKTVAAQDVQIAFLAALSRFAQLQSTQQFLTTYPPSSCQNHRVVN